ncbi:MAG: hypothetical protein ACLRWP_09365 [Bilophila wadsworthia]
MWRFLYGAGEGDGYEIAGAVPASSFETPKLSSSERLGVEIDVRDHAVAGWMQ